MNSIERGAKDLLSGAEEAAAVDKRNSVQFKEPL
jgi:hypothetical protein